MKLGVFDSGLGGLLIARAIKDKMPDVDIVYLGDTLHVPYGKRSPKAVYDFTKRAMDFLFDQDCQLIVIACNTASASALRQLQQIYLPKRFPAENHDHRRILGVVVPTLEAAVEKGFKNIGILGTSNIVEKGVYKEELQKIDPDIQIHQQAAPLLVPLIEDGGIKYAQDILRDYIAPLKAKQVDSIILGCTHYPYLKNIISGIANEDLESGAREINILSQDTLIPEKLVEYLNNHPEISNALSRKGRIDFFVTDITHSYRQSAKDIYRGHIDLKLVSLPRRGQEEDDYIPDLEKVSVK